MRGKRLWVTILGCALTVSLVPCEAAKNDDEPDLVVVQHILIGFKRSVPNKKLTRSRREAKELAEELLKRAREGEEFGALVEEYTDDKAPGIYALTNTGALQKPGTMTRDAMVTRFGDVAFGLEVGEVELATHHASMCRYGYHVIKRLE